MRRRARGEHARMSGSRRAERFAWTGLSFRSLRVVLSVLLGLSCNGCLYGRIVYYNSPSLAAPGYFDERVVHASTKPLPLPKSSRETAFSLTPSERTRYRSFDDFLEAQGTRAFLVIHDDAIVYERYFDGVSP